RRRAELRGTVADRRARGAAGPHAERAGIQATRYRLRSAVAKRKSVNGSRARHENPIPNASRVGNVVMSSVIGGTKPGTRELPASLEEQVANVFAYIKHDVEAAGGSVDDIIKITFWVKDPVSQRAALNTEW